MHQTDVLTPAAAREKEMADRGRRRAEDMIAKSIERGEIADTPAGLKLVSRELAALSSAIEGYVQDALSGRGGRNNTTAKLLKGVNPDLAAFITIRASLSAGVEQYHLKTLAQNVAATLELELLADAFEKKNGALFNAVVRRSKAKGLTPQRIAKAVALANKHFDVVPEIWDTPEKLHIGTKLVELFIQTSGLIQAPLVRLRNNRNAQVIQFGPGVAEWIDHIHARAVLSRPMWLPTLAVPKPWETIRGGGYETDFIRAPSIVSKPFGGQLKALREAIMPDVYEGLNGIQETPWRVNGRVMAVMQEAWDKSLPFPAVPSRDDLALPSKPEDIETNLEARKAYREEARKAHQHNAKLRAERFAFARMLDIAQENAEETFYFPHRLDFRGRCYAMSTALHPQGPDESRALLEFAEGKPLGERGLFWLGVHGANVFGNDKVSLEARFEWARDNLQAVLNVADDPLRNLWWTEADKPWSFLAWCFEWAGAWRSGWPNAFVSRLPIALDGSCNGIQHYSAMLRDEVGGAAVNLVPSNKPQDIYQEVADRVKEKLADVAGKFDHPDHHYAYQWQRFGIDRKITKRAVMVLPYGGTFKSCMDYVADATDERFAAGQEQPFGDELAKRKAQAYLAKLVWESIGEVVIKSREAMKWLQAVARICTAAGVPIQWTTPTGFIVKQDYRKVSARRIRTHFAGSAVVYRSVDETDDIDGAKQASALPPNVVHSLDASAMMRTIVAARAEGIRSFAMIHDSYGTHAADTERFSQILRECFVDMYSGTDFLEHFRDEVAAQLPPEYAEKLPPLPKKGSLDLSEVLNSDYFFA